MNATLCCSPLTFPMSTRRMIEPRAHEALAVRLFRTAKDAIRSLDGMARKFSSDSPEALRLAELIAREHFSGRL